MIESVPIDRQGSRGRIVVLATLDSKAEQASYIAERLRSMGHEAWLMDIGIGRVPRVEAHISREQVSARGEPAYKLAEKPTKTELMARAAQGAGLILAEMHSRGQLAGVIALGGGQGTWLCTTAMRHLPHGLPKAIVTTAAGKAGSLVGSSDIVVFPSVTDLLGLNRLLRPVLANAAAAVAGMVEWTAPEPVSARPLVAMTMFGVTTAGAEHVKAMLEAHGLEVAVFHANGHGGAAMEELVRRGPFAGVLDWTITELADELAGGIAGAGPRRLEAAGLRGLPQLVVPGALDVINFGPPSSVPEVYAGRTLHRHHPSATLMRTNADESRRLALLVARKINSARGPAAVLVPAKGFSALDREDGPFRDQAADFAFVTALREALRPKVPITVLPFHINDVEFARAAADTFLALLQQVRPAGGNGRRGPHDGAEETPDVPEQ